MHCYSGVPFRFIRGLERKFHFQYFTQNRFESEAARAELLERGMRAFRAGCVSKKSVAMGEMYRSLMEMHHFVPSEVRWIDENIGCGLFAAESIGVHQFVGEYTGLVRKNNRRYIEPLNHYCYEYPILDELGRSHVIDATSGSLARFINHSKMPNLKPTYVFLDGFFHVIFVALKKISVGEQLCYNYGPSYWYIRPQPVEIDSHH